MKKFCVFSGFLGSGKTTTMIVLTKYYSLHYGKAAMISNDLGHGVNLADNKLAALSGCRASEMTDECICFQHENLAAKLNSFFNEGCELVISDIPGFGVGALEHVYFGLSEKFPGQFELAPFTVLIEPQTVKILRSGGDSGVCYIHNSQLKEADLIVFNKCDTISSAQKDDYAKWLKASFPDAKVICISALKEEGLEELSQALRSSSASMRHPDINYESGKLINAMDSISEYYFQYRALVCCNNFDGNAYLSDLAEAVRGSISSAGYEIPHLKLLAWEPEGDFGKVDLIGKNRAIEITQSFKNACTDIAVILNASGICPAEPLDEIITSAAYSTSEKYNLEITPFKKECFNMGD